MLINQFARKILLATLFAVSLMAILPLQMEAKKKVKQPASLPSSSVTIGKYTFDTVAGDPLHALKHVMPNGLTVMLSQNPRQPRIQTIIGVRVGGKNDPAETTGLAHYFEHLMFKGTPHFGTVNYQLEKPMLDEIESLFETYRFITDSLTRAQLYHRIDSISFEASKLAIPNEYDKMMSAIGAIGTNAYTSTDATCYIEDIPSNELERWAMVQADRFASPVIRGFHTELETIYEEKNMSLTKDARKASEKMLELLFPSHPYGTQTVLGTQTHLKNPSITNIKKYHDTWYVPNNMMIAMSGDLNPEQALDVIYRYFGELKPNSELPKLEVKAEQPITEPVRGEVWGNDAERLTLAWRIPASKDPDIYVLSVVSDILSNGSAGLIDLNLKLPHKVLGAGAGLYDMADQGAFMMIGNPLQGQTLEDVETLLLGELAKVRAGEFSDELLASVKANAISERERTFLDNADRATYFIDAFINGEDWADAVAEMQNYKNISREDVVRVANKYLGASNYVAVNKRQGPPQDELKIAKPAITPIVTNRDTTSVFLNALLEKSPEPIEPKFVDYQKELTKVQLADGVDMLYTHNPYNNLFDLTFIYESGSWAEKILPMAARYIKLVGTPDMSAAQVREAFYSLACDYRVSIGGRRSYIVLHGLSENMGKAIELFNKLIAQSVSDPQTLADFIASTKKSRENAKSNQQRNFAQLRSYVTYGADYVKATAMTDAEVEALDAEKMLGSLRELTSLAHRVIYYGPMELKQVENMLEEKHVAGRHFSAPGEFDIYRPIATDETVIYLAPYDAKQLYLTGFSNLQGEYDPMLHPVASLYNEYFGGSMNAIVFQEMREARSLAYSAGAFFSEPSRPENPYTYITQIATQNDKLLDAMNAFDEIINDMPRSESAFILAKEGLINQLRTDRVIDDNIAWAYIADVDRDIAPSLDGNGKNRMAGLSLNRLTYEALPGLTLDDVVRFQQEHVRNHNYNYGILGKIEDLDTEALTERGKVVILTSEDIFGY